MKESNYENLTFGTAGVGMKIIMFQVSKNLF